MNILTLEDLENSIATDWRDALVYMTGKGYRKTSNGRYETFVSVRCKTLSLGTYETIDEAEAVLFDYKAHRLIKGVESYGLDIDDGVLFMDRYLAFPEGLIFNLYGERMVGGVNRDGYLQSTFNNRNIHIHRIVALLFCPQIPGKDFVNHIDGDKLNNHIDNLEWVTRSENTLHSFRHGLQNNIGGVPVYSDEEHEYIKKHCFDTSESVAYYLGRNRRTVSQYMRRYRKEKQND